MKTCMPSILIVLLLGACGGGGGGPETLTLDLPLVQARSGIVLGSGGVFTVDAIFGPSVGDGQGDVGLQGCLSYSLAALPQDAEILDATLLLTVELEDGGPFGLGSLVLDHADLGAALDGSDYVPQLILVHDRVVATAAGPANVDVTEFVAEDLAAGGTFTDYRLRFPVETDHDQNDDQVYVPAADPTRPASSQAMLQVTYRR